MPEKIQKKNLKKSLQEYLKKLLEELLGKPLRENLKNLWKTPPFSVYLERIFGEISEIFSAGILKLTLEENNKILHDNQWRNF